MKSLDLLDMVMRMLREMDAFVHFPGYAELMSGLKDLHNRLHHRLHRREHNGSVTEIIELDGVELVVDYTYTPEKPAPPCSNPSHPNYGIPPEPEVVEIHHIWSHDNIAHLLAAECQLRIENKIARAEREQREKDQWH